MNTKTLEHHFLRNKALGPDALATWERYRHLLSVAPRPEPNYELTGRWSLDCLWADQSDSTFYPAIASRRQAENLRQRSILSMLEFDMGSRLVVAALPAAARTLYRVMHREAGKLERKKPKWTAKAKRLQAARTAEAWVKRRNRSEAKAKRDAARERAARIATIPPLHPAVHRATVKTLARLREKYPRADDSTLVRLARIYGGALF